MRADPIPLLFVTHSTAEAVALGSRLLYLERGTIADDGAPIEVLSRIRSDPASNGGLGLEDVRNRFRARVEGPEEGRSGDPGGGGPGATRVRLVDGPVLVVPACDAPAGTRLIVSIRAEEVLLAAGPVAGLRLSARNVLPGIIERIVPHGGSAEVLVRTGGIVWIASVVEAAVEALEMTPGTTVHLVVKARGCHIRRQND